MIDVLIVGLIVALAILSLAIIIIRSIIEKKEYGPKQRKLMDEAKKVESSSLIS